MISNNLLSDIIYYSFVLTMLALIMIISKYYFLQYSIKRYQKKHDCYLLCLTNVNTGFLKFMISFFDYHIVDISDDETFVKQMQKAYDFTNLHIILHTFGGAVCSADIITQEILNFRKKGIVNIYVPQYAYSAGTLIALAGTNLAMNSWSLLSPTDPQIDIEKERYSSNILRTLLNQKNNSIQISEHTFLKAQEAVKLHNDNINTLNKLLQLKQIEKQKIKKIISELGSGKHPHHKPFSIDHLIDLGLKIHFQVSYQIMDIFNTMEYLLF